MIRVLVVDAHPFFLRGVRAAFATMPNITLVTAAVAVLLTVRPAVADPASSQPETGSQPAAAAPPALAPEPWPRWEVGAGMAVLPIPAAVGLSVSVYRALLRWLAVGIEVWGAWYPDADYRVEHPAGGYYACMAAVRASLPRRVSPFAQVGLGLLASGDQNEETFKWWEGAGAAVAVGLDVHVSRRFTVRAVSVEAPIPIGHRLLLVVPRLTSGLVVRLGNR
jgi:hypothetical protein